MSSLHVRVMTTAVLVAVGAGAGCGGDDDGELVDGIFTDAEWAIVATLSPLPEVAADTTNAVADDPDARLLGQALFFERDPAGALVTGDDGENGGLGDAGETGRVACASCHTRSSQWLDDDRSNPANTSLGADWGVRNAPPVVNAPFYRWFNWAGSVDSLWAQVLATTESGVSHNSTRLDVAHMIFAQYREPYEALFGPMDERLDPEHAEALPPSGKPGQAAFDDLPDEDQVIVNTIYANYGKVIAAYERQLVSRDAPFDRYVAGETDAITTSAKRGLQLFIGKAGCVHCHSSPLFSDNSFHNVGVPQRGEHVPAEDTGRFAAVAAVLASAFNSDGDYSDDTATGKLGGLVQDESQRGQFRTKHLRQVAETGPYMHTGDFATLTDVVEAYNAGGAEDGFAGEKDDFIRPLNLDAGEIEDLVAFLETLTGAPVADELLDDLSVP